MSIKVQNPRKIIKHIRKEQERTYVPEGEPDKPYSRIVETTTIGWFWWLIINRHWGALAATLLGIGLIIGFVIVGVIILIDIAAQAWFHVDFVSWYPFDLSWLRSHG